ncbi:MAG: SufD family Fe-S cluster assembly protein, partial [Gammaproteobacteria bacterium]|nr:SufD family Fe-S cluster assembly protein [Gammaproteobacteria bacterium]
IDNHTYVDHAVANCTSKEYYKGILDGRSRAVFHGRVLVRQDAQQTDAEQNNQNLLLSKNAEVDTKPQLEIYADDVKCSHGATVGQLDNDAVFYLRSRGIAVEQARDLLTYAFANEVLSRIEIEPVRRSLEHTLSERLLHGRSFEEVA